MIHQLLLTACLVTGQAGGDDDIQDVLYLGAGKPTVVRLRVTAGGKPVQARWDEFMEKLFKHLDVNRSGGLDRIEVTRAFPPAQLSQMFQGQTFNQRTDRPGVAVGPPFEQMDANRDGKVTLDEMKAYYVANGCGPLLVNSPFIGENRGGSGLDPASDRLFQMLDTDGDGKLSKAELSAAERLLRYDDNDDELVSTRELGIGQTGRGGFGGFPMMRPPPAGKEGPRLASLLLVPTETGPRKRPACLKMARELIARLDKKKAGKLKREETPFSEAVFEEIDRNRDGLIDATELARVLSMAASGEFGVRMGGTASRTTPAKAERKSDTLALKIGSARMTVVAGPMTRDYGESGLEEFLMGFYRAADKDKRGFITRGQLTGEGRFALAAVFDLADRNRDGRLTEAEIAAYVEVADGARGVQLTMTLTESGQGLFQAIDANRDGVLSVRELRSAWTRLADMDANGDGMLEREEFPTQVTLLVGAFAQRGDGGQPERRVAPDRGPIWFRKMDRNGDGDVSRSEWLGTQDEFDRIDADKDGIISLDEAEEHDAKVRKK